MLHVLKFFFSNLLFFLKFAHLKIIAIYMYIPPGAGAENSMESVFLNPMESVFLKH